MKRIIISAGIFLAIFISTGGAVYAGGPEDNGSIALSAGKRNDSLDWNIAGNTSGSKPNILSELKWNNLDIFQVKVAGKAVFASEGVKGEGYYLRGSMGYGWINSGTNQDSDYAGDDRSGEYSRSNNNAGNGSVADFTLGMGYRSRFDLDSSVLDVAPLAGYSQHRQNLTITDGYQTIPATGAFAGLYSTYKARWQGPWMGIDFNWMTAALGLHAGFEYHIASYRAEANWNLRSDFNHPKSFEHFANGTGLVYTFGGDYNLGKNWLLAVDFDYQKWQASGGIDRTYFSNGITADTRLNEVNWRSYAYMVGIRKRF